RKHSRVRPRSARALALLLPLAAALAGCVTDGQSGMRPAQEGIVDQVREVDLSGRHARYAEPAARQTSSEGAQPASYYGDGTPPILTTRTIPGAEAEGDKNAEITGAVTTGTERNAGNKGYDINFENTPIPTVAKTLLGDILGVGYAIDPR